MVTCQFLTKYFYCSHLKQKLVYKAGAKGVSLPRNSGVPLEEKLKKLIENHNKNQREKNMAAIESSLTRFHAEECSFVLVIIPTKNGPLYAQVISVIMPILNGLGYTMYTTLK